MDGKEVGRGIEGMFGNGGRATLGIEGIIVAGKFGRGGKDDGWGKEDCCWGVIVGMFGKLGKEVGMFGKFGMLGKVGWGMFGNEGSGGSVVWRR